MANNGMYIATSGMIVDSIGLQTVAENLSNINTTGFKENFQANTPMTQVNMSRIRSGMTTPIGTMENEVISAAHYRNWTEGGIQHTAVLTDVAINGPGFFEIGLPGGGVAYTRDGNFALSPTGNLVTQSGGMVLNTTGTPIVLGGSNFSIDQQGNITQNGSVVGQIGLVDFANPNLLTPGANNLFTAPAGVAPIASGATVMQGYLESSNVNMANQISQMVQDETSLQGNVASLRTVDAMTNAITQVGWNQV